MILIVQRRHSQCFLGMLPTSISRLDLLLVFVLMDVSDDTWISWNGYPIKAGVWLLQLDWAICNCVCNRDIYLAMEMIWQYAIFGKVTKGDEVLSRLEDLPTHTEGMFVMVSAAPLCLVTSTSLKCISHSKVMKFCQGLRIYQHTQKACLSW